MFSFHFVRETRALSCHKMSKMSQGDGFRELYLVQHPVSHIVRLQEFAWTLTVFAESGEISNCRERGAGL